MFDYCGYRTYKKQCFFWAQLRRHPTPLPYLNEWKHIDYGLQHKIVIELTFELLKQYES